MQSRSWKLFIAVTVVFGAASVRSEEPIRIRVLSYNIHHGQGIDGQLDLGRIARVIVSAKPDLVALQEVDRRAERSDGVDQPAELARLTGLKVAFGDNIELEGGHYGNAVLSRFPIITHRNHLLPNLDDGEQRGVLAVEVLLRDEGPNLRLLATHFDHRPNDRERVLSAAFVNSLVANDDRASILMGDINDVVGSQTLTRIESVWRKANAEPVATIPVTDPQRQIDFVLLRPGARWRVIRTRVLDEAVASDHRGLLSVLELNPE